MSNCALPKRRLQQLVSVATPNVALWIRTEVLEEAWSIFCRSAFQKRLRSNRYSYSTDCIHLPRSSGTRDSQFSFLRSQSPQAVYSKDPIWRVQHRRGSSVPGPLEARKRRSLFRRMMDYAFTGRSGQNPDVDVLLGLKNGKPPGADEDPGGHDDEILTHFPSGLLASPPSPPPMVQNPSSDPVNENNLYIQEGEGLNRHEFAERIHGASFLELYNDIFAIAPEVGEATDILSLLKSCTKLGIESHKVVLSRVQQWVEIEVALGLLGEDDIRLLLRGCLSHQSSQDARMEFPWDLCVSIWNGIRSSKVRKLTDFKYGTTLLLLQAIEQDQGENYGLSRATEMLKSLGEARPNRAASLLLWYSRRILDGRRVVPQVIFDNGQFFGRYETLISLFRSVPQQVSSRTVVLAIATLIRELRESTDNEADKRYEWLKLWLSALSRNGLLREARKSEKWQSAWRHIEKQLSSMDIAVLASYLDSFTDREICAFIVEHFVYKWQVPRIAALASSTNSNTTYRESRETVLKTFPLDNVPDKALYPRLMHLLNSAYPHLTGRFLRLLYPLMYYLDKPEVVLTLTRHFNSMRLHTSGLSLETLFSEVARWTEVNPVFALRLVSADKRPAAGLCPSLPRALELAQKCPTEVLLSVAYQLLRTYGARHPSSAVLWTRTRYSVTQYSSGLLHEIALRIASQGDIQPTVGLRRIRRILMLFRDAPEQLQKQMALALTRMGVANSLKARRKVPGWRLQWIGYWINALEGSDVWRETEAKAGLWWRRIEEEEAFAERVWQPGTGWVPRGRQTRP